MEYSGKDFYSADRITKVGYDVDENCEHVVVFLPKR